MMMTAAAAAAMTDFVFNFSLVAAFSPRWDSSNKQPDQKKISTLFLFFLYLCMNCFACVVLDSSRSNVNICNFEIFTRSTICTLDTTLSLFLFFFFFLYSRRFHVKQRNRSRSILAGLLATCDTSVPLDLSEDNRGTTISYRFHHLKTFSKF